MKTTHLFLLVLLALTTACGPAATALPPPATAAPPTATPPPPPPPTSTPAPAPTEIPATPTELPPMTLSSAAFEPEGDIPLRHAQKPFSVPFADGSFLCPGSAAGKENLSPPLEWANVPLEAQSLALIVVDDLHFAYPDAPEGTFFPHWVVYNVAPSASGLTEGLPAELSLPDGALQGLNAYPAPYDQGYGGPCPEPGGRHLYIFTLYALDTALALAPGADYQAVLAAMEGHVLSQAELRGYYTGQ